MGNQDAITAGYDTARVPVAATEGEAQQRLEGSAVNRRKLATLTLRQFGGVEAVKADPELAMYVANLFVERCGQLGLDVNPPGPPGVCRRPGCSNELSAASSVRPSDHERRGYCSLRCVRLANLGIGEGVS